MKINHVVITGAAGFIGFYLSKRLLEKGVGVTGIDNMNDYYDVTLKTSRLNILNNFNNFTFHKIDIANREALHETLKNTSCEVIVNLAAQAGVRYSLINPYAYVDSNLSGFVNLIECARQYHIQHFVFASSSSVYGANTRMPFSVHDNVDHPVSLYAATKKSNELIAHTYSHLYQLPCTGLRFFTVYGPWGRPDMAYFLFTKAIIEGQPIKVFNHGKMKRDFTYIDDIVEGILGVMHKKPDPNPSWTGEDPDPGTSYVPYRIYNIGNNIPVELKVFIETIEEILGKKAVKEYQDMQPGDVPATFANIDALKDNIGFKPNTSLKVGLTQFVSWYKSYYNV